MSKRQKISASASISATQKQTRIQRITESSRDGSSVTREMEVSTSVTNKQKQVMEIQETVTSTIRALSCMNARQLITNSKTLAEMLKRINTDMEFFENDEGSLPTKLCEKTVKNATDVYGFAPLGYYSFKEIVDSGGYISAEDMCELLLVKAVVSASDHKIRPDVKEEMKKCVSIHTYDASEGNAVVLIDAPYLHTLVDIDRADASTMLLLAGEEHKPMVMNAINDFGCRVHVPDISLVCK